MTYRTLCSRIISTISALLLSSSLAGTLWAQTKVPVRALITAPVDESQLVSLPGRGSGLLKGAKDPAACCWC
jgi:hypothetical protein